jgi:Na+-transporting methylmalonyl-CoA/oxaloacetate decarboxylase gamma subunit
VFFQLFDGMSMGAVIAISLVCVTLALARVVRNLPKDTIARFFEHRTTKYQIIASDSKGRVATMQKQRLVFLGFALICLVIVALAFLTYSMSDQAANRPQNPAPTASEGSHRAP